MGIELFQKRINKFLHSLTFQASSKENDKGFLSSENIGNLVLDILESFAKLQLVEDSKILGKKFKTRT